MQWFVEKSKRLCTRKCSDDFVRIFVNATEQLLSSIRFVVPSLVPSRRSINQELALGSCLEALKVMEIR